MAQFGFYHDNGAGAPNFSRPVTPADPLLFDNIDQAVGGTVDKRMWFGSDIAGSKVEANSNPGVDQVNVAPQDSNLGNPNPTSRIKIAATQGGLAGAAPGGNLNLGTVVNGGAAPNPKEIWVRYTMPAGETAAYTDLSYKTNNLKHTPA